MAGNSEKTRPISMSDALKQKARTDDYVSSPTNHEGIRLLAEADADIQLSPVDMTRFLYTSIRYVTGHHHIKRSERLREKRKQTLVEIVERNDGLRGVESTVRRQGRLRWPRFLIPYGRHILLRASSVTRA